MNKLRVVNDIIDFKELDDAIYLDYVVRDEMFDVSTINLIIKKSTHLDIDYIGADVSKLNICIHVLEGVKLDLFELRTGVKNKVKYTYIIDAHAKLNVYKVYSSLGMRELDIVDLNGEEAKITYRFKTVSVENEKYDIVINHNAKNTTSYINNNGLNKEQGSLIFNVTSVVPKSITGCVVDQKNRIITMNDNKCKISPSLLIDEFDTVANHGAHIGNFKESELFYLMSRGIKEDVAKKLLIKGFLLSDLVLGEKEEKVLKILDKHWR